MKAVSLFSNCGAGDIGYRKAGFRFEVMAELCPRRLEVCLLNHPGAKGISGDLRVTWNDVVQESRLRLNGEELDLLAACPPCQGMSSARAGRGMGNDADAGSRDGRNLLVTVIAQVVAELNPKILVVENVPTFLTRKVRHPDTGAAISAAQLLNATLSDRYLLFPLLTDLSEFGVPQTRKRTFLTFIRRDLQNLTEFVAEEKSPYPKPSHGGVGQPEQESLESALTRFDLPQLDAASAELAHSQTHYLHSVPVWKSHHYSMVAAIPPNSGLSAWNNSSCRDCGQVEVDTDAAICPLCQSPLLRPVVQEGNTFRLVRGFKSSYRRMSPERPASTITTASGHLGSDYTIHPEQNRLLSPLECALLQTFPTDFQWGNSLRSWGQGFIRAIVGEAVPPHFTELHGRALRYFLEADINPALLNSSDDRILKAWKKISTEIN